jgi:hypothetical protein
MPKGLTLRVRGEWAFIAATHNLLKLHVASVA